MPQNPLPSTAPRAFTWRSLLLGSLGVILICGVTPYNDYVVANTFMVGSYLPLVVVLSLFLLSVVVNAPLHRFAPRAALSPGELSIILLMMLLASAFPSTGMMRYLPGMIIGPFIHGQSEPQFWKAFVDLGLPQWLYPAPLTVSGPSDPVVQHFIGRSPTGEVPFGAWLLPFLGWGSFLLAAMLAMVAMAGLVRPQWADNERLAFPLTQLQLALVEPPEPGRKFNAIFGSRSFWTALIAVVFVHTLGGLNLYTAGRVPAIPVKYDLTGIFSEEPWLYLPPLVKASTVYFTFIGIAYFIQSRTSFSLWAIFLATQLLTMQVKSTGGDISDAAWQDQHLGATVAFALGVLWIGRRHWGTVVQSLWRRDTPRTPTGYLSGRTGMILLLSSVGVMFVWLATVGVTWWVAIGIVMFILIGHMVAGRVVAETGMPILRIHSVLPQFYTNLPTTVLTGKDVVLSNAFATIGSASTREGTFGFALHGLQTLHSADAKYGATDDGGARKSNSLRLLGLVIWTLLLGFVVAAASILACHYLNSGTLSSTSPGVVNAQGTETIPRSFIVERVQQHTRGIWPARLDMPWMHMAIGFGLTVLLQFASLRFNAWPLMPVGYLLSPTWLLKAIWFSIFLGWLTKVIILRFGGPSLFIRARGFFFGLIFGEALAAAGWMIVTLVLAILGYDYEVMQFLPA